MSQPQQQPDPPEDNAANAAGNNMMKEAYIIYQWDIQVWEMAIKIRHRKEI